MRKKYTAIAMSPIGMRSKEDVAGTVGGAVETAGPNVIASRLPDTVPSTVTLAVEVLIVTRFGTSTAYRVLPENAMAAMALSFGPFMVPTVVITPVGGGPTVSTILRNAPRSPSPPRKSTPLASEAIPSPKLLILAGPVTGVSVAVAMLISIN